MFHIIWTSATFKNCVFHDNSDKGLYVRESTIHLHGEATAIHSNGNDGIQATFAGKVVIHLPSDLATEIYSTANLKSNEYFIDIGSGIGQAVIQASIEYPNVHAFGLELLENRHNHALSLQSKVYAIIMKYLYLQIIPLNNQRRMYFHLILFHVR